MEIYDITAWLTELNSWTMHICVQTTQLYLYILYTYFLSLWFLLCFGLFSIEILLIPEQMLGHKFSLVGETPDLHLIQNHYNVDLINH